MSGDERGPAGEASPALSPEDARRAREKERLAQALRDNLRRRKDQARRRRPDDERKTQ